jgi:hypothetical protein
VNQHTRELIIEIDDRVDELIQEINAAPASSSVDFVDSLQQVIIGSILGPFGLSASIFDDRDGGNVTTVNNFQKGIVASDADATRHEGYAAAQVETFGRSDYERNLPKERKNAFKGDDVIHDAYSGAELPKNGRTVRDHVVSAHEIEMSVKGHLGQNRDERVAVANQDANKVWTHASTNASKQDKDLLQWAGKPNAKDPARTNTEVYASDPEKLQATYVAARNAVDRAQNIAVLKKQAGEFMKQGGVEAGKLAIRQVFGLLLKDLVEGFIHDIKDLVREGFESLRQLAEMVRRRLEKSVVGLKERWAEYLKEGLSAGISGLLSGLVTLLVNSLVTTAKHIVTIIREGTLAVVKSVKLIVSPEPGMTGFDIAVEVLKLLSGSIVTAVGLGMQEAVAKLVASVPILAPLADEIAGVAVAILSGLAGLLTVLAFDQIKDFLAFRRKQLADRHRENVVTLLKIKRTVIAIGEAQAFITRTNDSLRQGLAHDWASVGEAQAEASQAVAGFEDSVHALSSLLEKSP